MHRIHPKFDSLSYLIELKKAGFTEKQAILQSETLLSVVEQQLLTKEDMNQLEVKLDKIELSLRHDIQEFRREFKSELKYEVRGLRHENGELGASLRHELKELATELRHEMKEMEAGLRHEMQELETRLRHEMKEMETRIIFKLGALMILLFRLFGGFLGILIKLMH
jgi:hypothetical protein